MPALDDHIDGLFDTYLYHITTPEKWAEIQKEGLKADKNGEIFALTTNKPEIVDYVAINQMGITDIVIIKFNPCNVCLQASGEIDDDNAGDSTTPYQQIIYRNIIGPPLLEKDGERKLDLEKVMKNFSELRGT